MAPDRNPMTAAVRKSKDQPERRVGRRIRLELPVTVAIIIPEQTFQARPLRGKSINFGPGGMKLTVEDMTPDLSSLLLGERRFIRIAFTSPSDHQEIKVTGRVLGMDFFGAESSNGRGPCDLRVFIDEGMSDTTGRYESFIDAAMG